MGEQDCDPPRLGMSSDRALLNWDRRVRRLARSHYENFSVASRLLPLPQRHHLERIYFFLREADDYADEIADPDEAKKALEQWEGAFISTLNGNPPDPKWNLLGRTIKETNLPRELFLMLISAFRQDREVFRYSTWGELMNYTRRSAEPVGRMVLMLFNYRDEALFTLSDFICTALQLTNFWQDISEDSRRGRIYIPLEVLRTYRVEEEEILQGKRSPRADEMVNHLVRFTQDLYFRGRPLVNRVSGALRAQLYLYWQGGWEALKGVEKLNGEVLRKKPRLSMVTKARIFVRALTF